MKQLSPSLRSRADLEILRAVAPELESIIGADVLALGFTKNSEGSISFNGSKKLLNSIQSYFEINLIDEVSFFSPSAKAGELFEIPVLHDQSDIERLYLVGLGDESLTSYRAAGAAIGRKVRGKAIEVISLCAESASQIKAHGVSALLGAYVWNLKTEKAAEIPSIVIATKDEETVQKASVIAEALYTARDLIHTPSNIKNPQWMADEAKKIADDKGLAIKVLSGKELAQFGGLRAVGNSSPNPGPRFIELSYLPRLKASAAAALPHIVIVGKGITFDTGGVSLKRPYEFMTAMKSDMAGAAAILGTLTALEQLQPNVRVTALMMMAENAISATAQRPSDVIKHYGGTTVEVINTDAEGRLVLADGLAYADAHLDQDYLVDIATLTGAIKCMASSATVTTRPCDRSTPAMPPATSICDSTQPPKISPLALVSAGMAIVRTVNSPRGSSVSMVICASTASISRQTASPPSTPTRARITFAS